MKSYVLNSKFFGHSVKAVCNNCTVPSYQFFGSLIPYINYTCITQCYTNPVKSLNERQPYLNEWPGPEHAIVKRSIWLQLKNVSLKSNFSVKMMQIILNAFRVALFQLLAICHADEA